MIEAGLEGVSLRDIVAKLSVREKAQLMTLYRSSEPWGAPRVGLGTLRFSDGPAGVRGAVEDRPLLTPCELALGASWDVDLLREVGKVVGDEARRRDVQVLHAPNVNLVRGPLGGRSFEQYGEDPWLTGTLGAAWIAGVQSRRVGAVAKHLVCNDSETDRQTMNSVVGEEVLRETYLLPFELAVQAGVWGVMAAYNRVNGVYCAEHDLINDVLKAEWGFDGFVISDAGATHSTVASALAGLDVELPGPGRPQRFGEPLAEAVHQGLVDEEVLDQATERLLRLAARVGRLGDGKGAAPEAVQEPRSVLLGAAAAGFVLLKNDPQLLPLQPDRLNRIAVIGPNATAPCFQGGAFSQLPLPRDIATPLSSIRESFGGTAVVEHEIGVLSSPKVPPLTEVDIVAAEGRDERGLTVEYFVEGSTEPVAVEVRAGGSMIWMPQAMRPMPGFGDSNSPGRVHARGVLTPHAGGTHRFFAGSSAAYRLSVGGREVLAQGEQPPIDDMGALMRPVVRHADVDLVDGVPVLFDVEMRFGPSRAHSLHVGCRPPEPPNLLQRAIDAARRADVAIVVVGETQDTALESADRTDSLLPGRQVELIERVCEVNPRTVVVVNAAHAVDMTWADRPSAVLCVWFPGQEFGPALAAVLRGDLEPGGRLPVTVAAQDSDYDPFNLVPTDGDLLYEAQATLGYRHFDREGIAPRFEFGSGMGYAQFDYESVDVADVGGRVEVRVTVRNTSQRAGKEVVQVYVRPPAASGRDWRELKGFAALEIAPGDAAVATIALSEQAFRQWSPVTNSWTVTPGRYEVLVGHSSRDIRARHTVDRS